MPIYPEARPHARHDRRYARPTRASSFRRFELPPIHLVTTPSMLAAPIAVSGRPNPRSQI